MTKLKDTPTRRIRIKGDWGVIRYAIVDADNYMRLRQFKWYIDKDGYAVSPIRESNRRYTLRMHRLVLNPAPKECVDHINRRPLDNRRANLRIANKRQNLANTPGRSKSGFKGVYFRDNKWIAKISYNRCKLTLGRFSSPKDAAKAYDEAAVRLFGEFAYTNYGKTN